MAENPIFEAEPEQSQVHIQYHKAIMSRRIFSKVVDFLLLIVFGLAFFIATRAIIQATPFYQEREAYIDEVMLDSGLYVQTSKDRYDIVTYDQAQDMSASELMKSYVSTIDHFIQYVKEKQGNDAYSTIQSDYDSYRLNMKYEGTSMFITSDEEIVMNPEFKTDDTYQTYSEECYEPYIDNHCRSFLLSLFPKYLEYTRYMSNIVLIAELPVAVILASLLTFLVPPMFIFKRNRQTLGMFIYHIGKADSQLLHVSNKKYLIYLATWIIGIICLSFLTLGMPLIISATMMIFTKQKQDFADYMLQLYDLDISNDKIYYSLVEIAQEHSLNEKVSDTFKPESRL